MEFRNTTLANGLDVVSECNPQAYSSSLAFFVKTGARDELDELSGVSHFLEHMVFKGTPRRTAADVNRELDEIGSHSNAFTSEEQTVYYATVLPEFLGQAVDVLADIMRPSLRDDDFAVEQKVILEEIAKYENQPPFGAHEKCMSVHFSQHPLARSVLGTTKSVSALTPEQMRDYFRSRYSPSNMALVAAGNIDFESLVKLAQRYCGDWERHEVERDTSRGSGTAQNLDLTNEMASQKYVVLVSDGPAAKDPDRYASRILCTIFGDDSGSRLYWELVDSGRAEYAAVSPYEFDGSGILMTFLCSTPELSDENLATVQRLQEQIQADGVRQRELELAQNKICSHLVLQSERPANRLFSVGNGWIQRQQYQTVRASLDAYRAVTSQDVADVLQRYPLLPFSRVSVGPA